MPAKPSTPRPAAVAPVPPSSSKLGKLQDSGDTAVRGERAAVSSKKYEFEPPSGGWDAADSEPVAGAKTGDEAVETPRNLPPVKASPSSARSVHQTSPGVGGPPMEPPRSPAGSPARAAGIAAGAAGLGSAMREEVWTIVRAAVEEAMGPLVARQREMEARMERAERVAEGASKSATVAKAPAAATATSRQAALPLSSIPVDFGISLAPPEFSAPAPSLPRIDVARSGATSGNPARGSLPPAGTYGVTVMPSMRPTLDLASVGAVDISGFDGGRRKRMVGVAVVVIILLIVAGVVTTTVLSHS